MAAPHRDSRSARPSSHGSAGAAAGGRAPQPVAWHQQIAVGRLGPQACNKATQTGCFSMHTVPCLPLCRHPLPSPTARGVPGGQHGGVAHLVPDPPASKRRAPGQGQPSVRMHERQHARRHKERQVGRQGDAGGLQKATATRAARRGSDAGAPSKRPALALEPLELPLGLRAGRRWGHGGGPGTRLR